MGVNQRAAKIAFRRTVAHALRMSVGFTAAFRKVPERYAAYGEELPGANTQGATIEEARENLRRQQVSGTFGRPARKSVEGQQGRMEICLQ
jgi:hypothetical protein